MLKGYPVESRNFGFVVSSLIVLFVALLATKHLNTHDIVLEQRTGRNIPVTLAAAHKLTVAIPESVSISFQSDEDFVVITNDIIVEGEFDSDGDQYTSIESFVGPEETFYLYEGGAVKIIIRAEGDDKATLWLRYDEDAEFLVKIGTIGTTVVIAVFLILLLGILFYYPD